MTTTIIVTNPTRRRQWGFAWSCQPTGNGPYEIEVPTVPDYIGTLAQIGKATAADRTYASVRSDGTFTTSAWFYAGRRITAIDGLSPKLFMTVGFFGPSVTLESQGD